MISENIPYLYNRNGIYYYRTRNKWKSLRTRCKAEAFKSLCKLISRHVSYTESSKETLASDNAAVASFQKKANTKQLVTEYLKENGHRWSSREYTRINSSLQFLPKTSITKDKAICLKKQLLASKTITTFNRYLKYYNAFYRWVMANHAQFTINPFDGLKVIEKLKPISERRNAYTPEQMKILLNFANTYGKEDRRYWLIMIGRYTGARMNEICQLKPDDITPATIHIRCDVLKTQNARRSIPLHPKLIELGLLDWVTSCKADRLFHEWKPVRGSHSHAASRWFSRNNPFKSKIKGERAEVDFHSLRHTVATELKQAGVPSQYAAQILGHNNGNITYDRYGKSVNLKNLIGAVDIIGEGDL